MRVPKNLGVGSFKDNQPFWGPLAAILSFSGGVTLRLVRCCSWCGGEGVPPVGLGWYLGWSSILFYPFHNKNKNKKPPTKIFLKDDIWHIDYLWTLDEFRGLGVRLTHSTRRTPPKFAVMEQIKSNYDTYPMFTKSLIGPKSYFLSFFTHNFFGPKIYPIPPPLQKKMRPQMNFNARWSMEWENRASEVEAFLTDKGKLFGFRTHPKS